MPDSADDSLRVEYLPISDLVKRRHPDNPKDHDLGGIDRSFDAFGFVTPGVIDERTGLFAEGHGRLDALVARKQQGRQPPRRIKIGDDGDWLVPVFRGVAFESDAHLRAFLITANRLTVLGGGDEPKLLANLQTLAAQDEKLFEATGFDADDMRGLILDLQGNGDAADAPEPKIDEIEQVYEKWAAKLGDLWLIASKHGGAHRLVCGDSTDAEVVRRALGDLHPNLMITDPPYGVNYDPEWRADYDIERFGHDTNHHLGTVSNDDIADWTPALKLFPGNVMYVCHAGVYAPEVGMGIKHGCGFDIRAQIIWKKQNFVMSRGAYHWQHEPIYYAVRKGCKANWNGDRTQSTVWEIANMSAVGKNEEDAPTGHSTQKPVSLFTKIIANHTVPGEMIYDPFEGAGTCIAAAELTKRIGIGIEIDPKYVSLALERFAEMGLAPKLAD